MGGGDAAAQCGVLRLRAGRISRRGHGGHLDRAPGRLADVRRVRRAATLWRFGPRRYRVPRGQSRVRLGRGHLPRTGFPVALRVPLRLRRGRGVRVLVRDRRAASGRRELRERRCGGALRPGDRVALLRFGDMRPVLGGGIRPATPATRRARARGHVRQAWPYRVPPPRRSARPRTPSSGASERQPTPVTKPSGQSTRITLACSERPARRPTTKESLDATESFPESARPCPHRRRHRRAPHRMRRLGHRRAAGNFGDRHHPGPGQHHHARRPRRSRCLRPQVSQCKRPRPPRPSQLRRFPPLRRPPPSR